MHFYKETTFGWCRWERDWLEDASYTYISEGPVVVRCSGDVEHTSFFFSDNYDYKWDDYADEGMPMLDGHYMEENYG